VGAACSDSTGPGQVLSSITITPANVSVADGQSVPLGVVFRDQRGQTFTPSPAPTVSWSSTNIAVASVSANGLLTGERQGQVTIRAAVHAVNGETVATVAAVATHVVEISGNDQAGTAGETLEVPITVEVRDRHGEPVQGIAVQFAASAGGGELSPSSPSTGADGRASTQWTLATVAGANTGTVSAAGLAGSPIALRATGTPGPAAALDKVSGDEQVAPPGSGLPEHLVVKVADAHGNLVAGATVSWSVTQGTGTVDPAIAATDADGLARTTWTLGVEGENVVQASAADLPAVTFAARAEGGGPVEILVNGGFDADASGWEWSNIDGAGGWRGDGGNPGGYFILNQNGTCPVDPTIAQALEGLVVGGRYRIAGEYIPVYTGFGNPDAFSFGVAIDDEVLEEWKRGPHDEWTAFSVEFTATATTHMLSISAERNCDDSSYGIDNIAVDLVP
jgi:hypothetical protein